MTEVDQRASKMNVAVILRAIARANGWQVVDGHRFGDSDTYRLPSSPAKSIEVLWAASGGVLMAEGGNDTEWRNGIEWTGKIYRGDTFAAKTEGIVSALVARTDVFPPDGRSNYPAISEIVNPTLRLPDAPILPMRWYARPDGPCRQLKVAPRLASWEKDDHPDQARLRVFLDDAESLLADSLVDGPWALRLDVGLSTELDLLDKRDLDNYALPLASRLSNPDLVSVWCTKKHRRESFVRVEAAEDMLAPPTDVILAATTASWATHAAQEELLAATEGAPELPTGPVRLELAFVVGTSRNWLNLWKPTIDALGDLLGYDQPPCPWNPRDGRITELGMHRSIDPTLGHDVIIAISATPA